MFKGLLTLILVSLTASSAYAVTSEQFENVSRWIDNECTIINKQCAIEVITDNNIQAYATIDNVIYISVGAIKQLSTGELFAVMLHEVGHIKNNDVARIHTIEVINPKFVLTREDRYKIEYNADSFAAKRLGELCQPNYLVQSLSKLDDRNGRQSMTHPDKYARINNVNKHYVNKCNK